VPDLSTADERTSETGQPQKKEQILLQGKKFVFSRQG
jgi:hypothetical protein